MYRINRFAIIPQPFLYCGEFPPLLWGVFPIVVGIFPHCSGENSYFYSTKKAGVIHPCLVF